MVFKLKGEWYVSGAAIGLWGAGCPESIYKDISLPAAQANYRASLYKNYIVRLTRHPPLGKGEHGKKPQLEAEPQGIRLVYERRPEENNPTAKHFLFFEREGKVFSITLAAPHQTYTL